MTFELFADLIQNINVLSMGAFIPITALALGITLLFTDGEEEKFLTLFIVVMDVFATIIFAATEQSNWLLAVALLTLFLLLKPADIVRTISQNRQRRQ